MYNPIKATAKAREVKLAVSGSALNLYTVWLAFQMVLITTKLKAPQQQKQVASLQPVSMILPILLLSQTQHAEGYQQSSNTIEKRRSLFFSQIIAPPKRSARLKTARQRTGKRFS